MKENKPNILIIHADQHRYDCLGAYNNLDVQTPNIDALAIDGVRYDNSFCTYPVCTPSRYSLLCGQYVHQHLGWSNRCTLPAGIPTFPRILRDAGYRTIAVGKMHFTPTYLDVGFDEMQLAEQDGPGRFDDDYHRWLRDEGLVDGLDIMDQRREYRQHAPQEYWDAFGALTSDLDEAHHSTTWIAERAMDMLQTWEDSGNLLMAGFIKPHHPFDPPAPWDAMYNPDALTLLPGWLEEPLACDLAMSAGYFPHTNLTEARLRRAMAYYYATISQIDHHVGRMLDLLKQKGLYDNTLIVYTSDHGDYLGFHHMLLKGNYMYDPLIKVPLIIKWPGQAHAGQVNEMLVSNVDLAPTLLHAANIDEAALKNRAVSMTGLDLDSDATRNVVFAEAKSGKSYMARTHTHKLLLCREAAQSQFFDLRDDPLELHNRFDDPACAGEIATLRDALLQWALFDEPSRVHLDHAATVITGDNVPTADDGHVDAMTRYFQTKMVTTPPRVNLPGS